MYRLTSVAAALCAFIALVLFPEAARQGAGAGLEICAQLIIPSLFPFFAASTLLSELGLAELAGRRLRSGELATAFLIGISGGYPLGAAYTAQLHSRGCVNDENAEKMLVCCNNSGPAFILGAVGTGIFHSSRLGLFLYAVHILSALCALLILSPSCGSCKHEAAASPGFAAAFTASVKRSVSACLSVCGFVTAFSVLTSLIDASGIIASLTADLSCALSLKSQFCRALLLGIFELGNAVAAMDGLEPCPLSLALASLLLSWGGISVHFQTFSVSSDIKLKAIRYMVGRLMIAVFSFILAYFGAVLIL